jgi:hypothetical protein
MMLSRMTLNTILSIIFYFFMLSVAMLKFTMLSVVMVNVMAPKIYLEMPIIPRLEEHQFGRCQQTFSH